MIALQKMMLGAAMCVVFGVGHAEVVAPDALIKNTVQEVIAIIKQDKGIQAGDPKKINALVDAKVLPHFDFVRMTQLAVGKSWRCPTPEEKNAGKDWVCATPEQKQALATEFRNMLVRTYTKVFTVYRDQAVEVKPLKVAAADTEVTVKTIISKPGSQLIPVDYEMKKAADGWKVFDISIDGVSMVMNYRKQFGTQIQEGGIDSLIKKLSDKNAHSSDTLKAESK